MLYICQSRPCAVAELRRLGERQAIRVEGLLPRVLYRYEIELDRVLDLTDGEVRSQVASAQTCSPVPTGPHVRIWASPRMPSALAASTRPRPPVSATSSPSSSSTSASAVWSRTLSKNGARSTSSMAEPHALEVTRSSSSRPEGLASNGQLSRVSVKAGVASAGARFGTASRFFPWPCKSPRGWPVRGLAGGLVEVLTSR